MGQFDYQEKLNNTTEQLTVKLMNRPPKNGGLWQDANGMLKIHHPDRTPNPTQLVKDLRECSERIGNMCAERRGPRMSVPVRQDDDDLFISNTVLAAAQEIERLLARG